MASGFTLPNSRQRIVVMGHTGCGKTQFANWLLSQASIQSQPWVVIDYKGDELINQIPWRREIGYNDTPKYPGVHVIHPLPGDEAALDDFLMKIYHRGNTGIYVDEAFMMPPMPKFRAYPALITQGRSKHIPMISLTQKPRYVPMPVFSEADFMSAFFLVDKRDRQRANDFMPVDLERELPPYHSHYYRVKDRARFGLLPAPDADTILETFARRLAPRRRMI